MAKNREQSAIDTIYELVEQIKLLHQKIDVMDNNIKLLNNKLVKAAPTQASTKPTAVVPESKSENQEQNKIKLFGRIKNQNKKPIKGVYIKIRNAKGDIINSRETNAEGYWEARVFPGQYVVELDPTAVIKMARPQNFNITLDETMNEYEVKGPQ